MEKRKLLFTVSAAWCSILNNIS